MCKMLCPVVYNVKCSITWSNWCYYYGLCDPEQVTLSFWVLVSSFVYCGPDDTGGASGSSILLFRDKQDSLPQCWPCLSTARD